MHPSRFKVKDANFGDVIGEYLYVLLSKEKYQRKCFLLNGIDKFSPQDEYTHPNRGQLLLSVKEIISQDTLESTLNFWHFGKK